jgi:hypothetical protein
MRLSSSCCEFLGRSRAFGKLFPACRIINVGSGVKVGDGVGLGVGEGDGTAVGVELGSAVLVGSGVSVGVGVPVGFGVAVGVCVAVRLGSGVGVEVGVFVGEGVSVGFGVGVMVGCAVWVAAIAACTVAAMSGVEGRPQATKNKLINVRRVSNCFTYPLLFVDDSVGKQALRAEWIYVQYNTFAPCFQRFSG